MDISIYKGLVEYSQKNRIRFQSLMVAGSFFLEGRADYNTRHLVFTTSNGKNRMASHVPEGWLRPPSPLKDVDVEDVGEKRKLTRGPGKKDYASSRSINQAVKPIFEKLYKLLGEETVGFSKSKRAQIIEGVINKLESCYEIEDCSEVNDDPRPS